MNSGMPIERYEDTGSGTGLVVPKLMRYHYTHEDMRIFETTVCSQIGLPTLLKVLEHFSYDEDCFRGFIKTVIEGGKIFRDVHINITPTDTAKEYHQEMYNIMFEVEFSDLPLYVNEHNDLKPVVAWRFSIGK